MVQLSGVKALEMWPSGVTELVEVYQRRRDYLCEGLRSLGWNVKTPKATMYVWAELPAAFKEMGSLKFCESLARETGVALSPGVGFGEDGEGYVRISLVTRDSRFYDMLIRLKKFQKVSGVTIHEPKWKQELGK
jgi:alanine-synthesizing transaminase